MQINTYLLCALWRGHLYYWCQETCKLVTIDVANVEFLSHASPLQVILRRVFVGHAK